MSDADEFLQQLGFSEYEARAYIALLQRNPLNGYELAKTSGIPRANIYAILQRLEERNAVIRIDTEGSTQYAPVYPDQLIPQMETRFQNTLSDAQRALETISTPKPGPVSRTVLGYGALLGQVRQLFQAAQEEIFIALWHAESKALAEDMAQLEQRNINVTTLCLQACPTACPGCRGSIYRYHLQAQQPARWLIVAQDNRDMTMGEIGPAETTALHTNQSSLVQLAIQYAKSNIAWAAVLDDPESNATWEATLSPETRRILHQICPDTAGWLTYMRGMLTDMTP